MICGTALVTGLLWPLFAIGTFISSWDLGAGVITLVATLVGVFAAFSLERAVQRRRDIELYATELDAARFELGLWSHHVGESDSNLGYGKR